LISSVAAGTSSHSPKLMAQIVQRSAWFCTCHTTAGIGIQKIKIAIISTFEIIASVLRSIGSGTIFVHHR
jgi:hypothetical protein